MHYQVLIYIGFLVLIALTIRGIGWLNRPMKVDVAMVQVAVDARSRRFVQDALARVAEQSDTATREGLVELLGGAVSALTAARLAWIYAGSENFEPMLFAEAQAEHTRLAVEARAGFQTELLRAADGEIRTRQAPDVTAQPHEGEGVVLVTLLVAAFGAVPDIDPTKVEEVERLLSALATYSPKKLIALEVVWTPSAEDDRMSTDELESNYPKLVRLVGVGGRVFCSYCGGPHTAELPKCPHCGAPTASADPAPA